MENNPIALIDMDGSVVDFDGAMKRDIKRLQSDEESDVIALGPGGDDPAWLEARERRAYPSWSY